MSGFKKLGLAAVLLLASAGAFFTFVAWLASGGGYGPAHGPSDDAILVMKFSGAVTLSSLIVALCLAKVDGGRR